MVEQPHRRSWTVITQPGFGACYDDDEACLDEMDAWIARRRRINRAFVLAMAVGALGTYLALILWAIARE